MLITFSSHNQEILHDNTIPVVSGDEAVAIIIALENAMARLDNCIGLAAPQIGISKSVAIIRYKDVSINLINPVLLNGEYPFISKDEGCMSFPKRRFDTPRFGTIKIRNHIFWPSPVGTVDLGNNPNTRPIDHQHPLQGMHLLPVESVYVFENPAQECGGVVAVAVQHEMDHLIGLTIDKKPGSIEKTVAGSDMVGRNDPCPCGAKDSFGKPIKFKKCCLQR